MNLNSLVDKIFVINIDSQTQNWELCKKEFEKIGVNEYERFPGIVPNGGKEHCDRVKGCQLSHLSIYRKIKENGWKKTLILEDDFECKENINSKLELIDDFLKNNDWHLFYLGGAHGQNYKKQSLKITEDIYKITRTYTTASYIINLNIIDKLIECSEKIGEIKDGDPTGLADNLLMDNIQPMGKCYHISPNLIYQRAGMSFIQGAYRNYSWIRGQ